MFLPKFDLPQIIKDFNQRKEKSIKTDENFGCLYLEKSLLADCRQLIDSVNDSSDLFYFSDDESTALNQHSLKLKTWRATAKSSPDSIRKIFDRFKQAYVLPPELASKRSLYDWRKQHHALFYNTENWINLAKEPVPLAQFHQLKADWKKQYVFALHSLQAISMVATNLLPSLIEHHQRALQDLRWNYFSMPSTIRIAYRKYLENFLGQAKQLQTQLAESMHDRLKVFSESKLTHADVIVHLADQLKIEHPPCVEKFNNQQFLQFHRYIQKHGSENLKKRSGELSWFKPNAVFPLQIIGKNEKAVIALKSLADAIPEKPRKPAWLFRGANLRYELCEKHALDFVTLQQLPDVSKLEINLSNIKSISTTLDSLQAKQQLANQLFDEIKKPPYSDLSGWHWRTHQFLKQYQALVHDYHHKTIAAQLFVAERMATHFLQSNDKVASALNMSQEAAKVLSGSLQTLQISIENSNNPALKARLQKLQNQCNEPLALNRVSQLLKMAAQGQLINEDDLYYIKTVLDNSEASTNPTWQRFTHQFSRTLLQTLLGELKRNPEAIFHQKQQIEHYSQIRQASGILQLLAPKYDAHTISKPLAKYFLYYLNAILRCDTESKAFSKNSALFTLFENVIDLFPKAHEIFIGNLSLAKCLGNFKHLREKKDWSEIQAEAESLAFILGEDYLIQHIDKACENLDDQIKDLIAQRMKPDKHGNTLTGALVFSIRDQLTAQNKQRVDSEIIASLKLHEQVLVGITQSSNETETREFIPALIEFSSQAQQLQQAMHDEQMSYPEKFEKVFAFQDFFDKSLARFKQRHAVSEDFGQRKTSPLFFKPYTALAAPTEPESKPSLTLSSNGR